MKSLVKGSVIYGLGQVLNKTISLLLLPFFTSYLTTKDYGITSVIGIYTLVVTSICTFGAGTVLGLIYFRSEDPDHRNRTINSAVAFMSISTLLALLVTIASLGPLNAALFGKESYSLYLMMSTVGALLNIIVMPVTLWMQFEQKAIPFVIINTSVVLTGIVMNIVAVMVLKLGIYGYIQTNLAAAILNVLIFGTYYLSKTGTRGMAWGLIRELIRKGWPLTFSFFFLFLIQNNSKYLLQLFSGLEAVGVFTIGFNLGTVISLLINSFNTAYYPYIMSFVPHPEKAPAEISAVAERYILGCCLVLTAVFIGAKPLVYTMVHPSFYAAHGLIGPVALGWVFSGLFIVIQPGLYYISKVHYISTVQMGAAIAGLLFSAALIPAFGALAAAWSFALGNGAMFLIMHLTNRKLRISHYYSGVSAKIWLNISLSVFFAGAWSWSAPEKNLILLSAMTLLCYLATMAWLNQGELRSIRGALQKKFAARHAS